MKTYLDPINNHYIENPDVPDASWVLLPVRPSYGHIWDATTTAWVVAVSPATQFAAKKVAALAAVDQFHATTVQGLSGNPTQVEKDSWAMKLATANAVVAKATVSAEGNAFLSALGLLAPATAPAAQIASANAARTAWAAAVQANAAKFAGLVGLADKLRSSAKAAVITAPDQVALDAAIAANKTAAQAVIAALPKV